MQLVLVLSEQALRYLSLGFEPLQTYKPFSLELFSIKEICKISNLHNDTGLWIFQTNRDWKNTCFIVFYMEFFSAAKIKLL